MDRFARNDPQSLTGRQAFVFEQADAPLGAAIGYLGGVRQDRLPGLIPNQNLHYQTRQALTLTIGCVALHENAFWNSGMFWTVPLTRKRPGECGSVMARFLASCGAMFSHQTCAKPRNRRCSGVKPSMVSLLPSSASCNAM